MPVGLAPGFARTLPHLIGVSTQGANIVSFLRRMGTLLAAGFGFDQTEPTKIENIFQITASNVAWSCDGGSSRLGICPRR